MEGRCNSTSDIASNGYPSGVNESMISGFTILRELKHSRKVQPGSKKSSLRSVFIESLTQKNTCTLISQHSPCLVKIGIQILSFDLLQSVLMKSTYGFLALLTRASKASVAKIQFLADSHINVWAG